VYINIDRHINPPSHVTHPTTNGTKQFAKLRIALFPYLYTAAHEAHATGLPLTRHHLLMFPRDREVRV
jgi:alpha-glucosidase (family GH31 glycosyl hydrolase)